MISVDLTLLVAYCAPYGSGKLSCPALCAGVECSGEVETARFIMRTPVVLSLVFVTTVLISGCGTGTDRASGGGPEPEQERSTQPANNRKVKKIGSLRRFSSLSDKGIVQLESVTKVHGELSGSDVKSTEQARTRPVSGQWIILDIKIKALANDVAYNALYFKLKNPGQKISDLSKTNTPYVVVRPNLGSGDLGTGQTKSGKVLMDAKARPGAKIYYTDALDKPFTGWRI